MGQVDGLPVGLSFVAGRWKEAELLRLGYAYERATHFRRPPTYRVSIEGEARTTRLFAPADDGR